jgi:hypothetical protein
MIRPFTSILRKTVENKKNLDILAEENIMVKEPSLKFSLKNDRQSALDPGVAEQCLWRIGCNDGALENQHPL